ncbi:MAG: 50S ribosomal protein L19 [Candidatus Marinimicrobia bacterium]|nr:50S ribosomal protein L19 [Candidatus Neomarinimicrobiota bacterium]
MDKLAEATAEQLRDDIPDFKAGDTIAIEYKIHEGARERTQRFQGVVIAIKGSGVGKTCTVRKISNGIGVERIFPIHSPKIKSLEKISSGKVRRSKLYYLRERTGKAAKIKEMKK